MKTLFYDGHKIEVKLWFTEKVFYDGKLMTSRFTICGGNHCFKVNENNEEANYEIEIYSFPSWGMTIRRNGVIIYSDK